MAAHAPANILLDSSAVLATRAPTVLAECDRLLTCGMFSERECNQLKSILLRVADMNSIRQVEKCFLSLMQNKQTGVKRRLSYNFSHVSSSTRIQRSDKQGSSTQHEEISRNLLYKAFSQAYKIPIFDTLYLNAGGNVLMHGMLYKKQRTGILSGKWVRRYFVLRGDFLEYYKYSRNTSNTQKVKTKRLYKRSKAMFIRPEAGDFHKFTLFGRSNVLWLKASSESQCHRWIVGIKLWLDYLINNDNMHEMGEIREGKHPNGNGTIEMLNPSVCQGRKVIKTAKPTVNGNLSNRMQSLSPHIVMQGKLQRKEGIRGLRRWFSYDAALSRHVLALSRSDKDSYKCEYIVLTPDWTLETNRNFETHEITIFKQTAQVNKVCRHLLRAPDKDSCAEWTHILLDTLSHIKNVWLSEGYSVTGNTYSDERLKVTQSLSSPFASWTAKETSRTNHRKQFAVRSSSMRAAATYSRHSSMEDLLSNTTEQPISGSYLFSSEDEEDEEGEEDKVDDKVEGGQEGQEGQDKREELSQHLTNASNLSNKNLIPKQSQRKRSSKRSVQRSNGIFERRILRDRKKETAYTRQQLKYGQYKKNQSQTRKPKRVEKLISKSIKRVATNAAEEDSFVGHRFGHLDTRALKKLVGAAFPVEVEPNETIFSRGDSGAVMYIVDRGLFFISAQHYLREKVDKTVVSSTSMSESTFSTEMSESSLSSRISSSSVSVSENRRSSILSNDLGGHTNGQREESKILKKAASTRTSDGLSRLRSNTDHMHLFKSLSVMKHRRSSSSAVMNKSTTGWSATHSGFTNQPSDFRAIELSAGDCFGKEALFHEATRPVTVKAGNKGGVLWAIEKDIFHKIAVRAHQKRMNRIASWLCKIPMFKENDVSKEEIVALAEIAEFHHLRKGFCLSESGYPIDFFLFILRGELSITKKKESKLTSKILDNWTVNGIGQQDISNPSVVRVAKSRDHIGSVSLLLPSMEHEDLITGAIQQPKNEWYLTEEIAVKSRTMMCITLTKHDLTRIIGKDRHSQFVAPEVCDQLHSVSIYHKAKRKQESLLKEKAASLKLPIPRKRTDKPLPSPLASMRKKLGNKKLGGFATRTSVKRNFSVSLSEGLTGSIDVSKPKETISKSAEVQEENRLVEPIDTDRTNLFHGNQPAGMRQSFVDLDSTSPQRGSLEPASAPGSPATSYAECGTLLVYPWVEYFTEDGVSYYHNEETFETRWYPPGVDSPGDRYVDESMDATGSNSDENGGSNSFRDSKIGRSYNDNEVPLITATTGHKESKIGIHNLESTGGAEKEDSGEESSSSDDEDYDSHDIEWSSGSSTLSDHILFDTIEFCKSLGHGAFSTVALVRVPSRAESDYRSQTSMIIGNHEYFAMKMIRKDYIMENGWEDLVETECAAMLEVQNFGLNGLEEGRKRFTLALHQAFCDKYCVYFMVNLCPGGELYDYCNKKEVGYLTMDEARFFGACIILALQEVHMCSMIYRDLKMENLVFNSRGYLILVDFGLAKKTTRTYTVCGTPEYMAPELILSTGHNRGIDLWALGISIFEMLCGTTPFVGGSTMETYENIVQFQDFSNNTKSSFYSHSRCDLDESNAVPVVDNLPWHVCDNEIDEHARDLVRRLLVKKRRHRLGARSESMKDLQDHSFFSVVDWTAMAQQSLDRSVIPYVPTMLDVSRFDSEAMKLSMHVEKTIGNGVHNMISDTGWAPSRFKKII